MSLAPSSRPALEVLGHRVGVRVVLEVDLVDGRLRPQYVGFLTILTWLPFFHSVHWKGPDPTNGYSIWYFSGSLTLLQMCSGMM